MPEILSLTSLRGIAALVVVFYHLEPRLRSVIDRDAPIPFINDGQLMVDFFFILSGFILAYAYAGDVDRAGTWRDVRKFFERRFARVYPMHIFMLALFLAYEILDVVIHKVYLGNSGGLWFEGSTSVASLFSNVILIQSWGLHDTLTWNQPSWSISVELAAYLAFPLLVWVLPLRRSVVAAVLTLALALAVLLFIQEETGRLTSSNRYAVLNCLAEFSIGVVLCFWMNLSGKAKVAYAGLLQAGAVAGIAWAIGFGAPDIVTVLFFALLVIACRGDVGWLGALLGRPLAIWLGRISYSLYISHYFFVRLFDAPWGRLFPGIEANSISVQAAILLAQFGLIMSFAHFSYVLIENPTRLWLRGRSIFKASAGRIEF